MADPLAVNCSHFRWVSSGSLGTVSWVEDIYADLRVLDITSRASGTATVIGASAIGRWK